MARKLHRGGDISPLRQYFCAITVTAQELLPAGDREAWLMDAARVCSLQQQALGR